MHHNLHAAANNKSQNIVLFLSVDGYKTTLYLECFQIICTDNLCKMKTIY